MISKNKIKLIQSLNRKKYRDETKLFVAEGHRLIDQLVQYNFQFHTIIAVPERIKKYSKLKCEILEALPSEMSKISFLKTAPDILAICYQNQTDISSIAYNNELVLALDDVQDPGNLGTIIRLASWFGIQNIICSENTADCYNPKVIQSTMGAIAKVAVHYTCLHDLIQKKKNEGTPIYGTFLDGENIYNTKLSSNGIAILGNEGNGISPPIEALVDSKLLIPNFSVDQSNVESLNVSMAASIVCSEFRRRII